MKPTPFTPARIIFTAFLLAYGGGTQADESAKLGHLILPSIPIEDCAEMRKAGDKFMKSLCDGDYETAFEELGLSFGRNKDQAAKKGAQLAGALRQGRYEINGELGEPIAGDFTFVGSRSLGFRLYTVAYLRRHQRGPFPVVISFGKADDTWEISQIALGEGHAAPYLNSLRTAVEPKVLAEKIPEFGAIVASTDSCMKLWTRGETRIGLETITKEYGGAFPKSQVESFTQFLTKGVDGRPETLGAVKSYELVAVFHLANDVITLTYGWHFKNGNSPVSFDFYRSKDGWTIRGIRLFDDAMPDLDAATVVNRVDLRNAEQEGAAGQPATAGDSE